MSSPKWSLTELLEQEARFTLDRFDKNDAWRLGSRLVAVARERDSAVTVSMYTGLQQVFHAALPGTSANSDGWIRRKGNVVMRFGHSSQYVAQLCEEEGAPLAVHGLDTRDYVEAGGGFPILIKDVGVIGYVAVGGLPAGESDHALVLDGLASF